LEAKAVSTPNGELATALLDRLEALGRTRREVLALALERIGTHGRAAVELEWLAKKLDSKSLWENPGARFLAAFLSSGDADAADAVVNLCVATVCGERAAELIEAIHTVLATELLGRIERALAHDDLGTASQGLLGLSHLSPASRVRPLVRRLRGFSKSPEVLSLIEVNESLLRRPDKTDIPRIEGILDAVRDAFSRPVGGAS
jgi:hypothetical protein